MDTNKRVVPDEATTDDVMSIFGWSRSEVSRRRRSGDLPEPDPWRGSERKPRWGRAAILDTLARMGRLDGVVLAAFEGSLDSPVRWARARVDQEFVRLPEMSLRGEERRTHLYRVVRYLRADGGPAYADTPEFQLSLCIAVEDPNPHRVFNALLVRAEVAHALGYGRGEAGTIAVILPDDSTDPQLRVARIPAEFPEDHVIKLERVPSEQMPVAAHLLGHPVPAWTEREITRTAIARWNPEDWAPENWPATTGAPEPVTLAVPRTLVAADAFRNTSEALLQRISTAAITAPREVPDSLRQLIRSAWAIPLSNMAHRRELPEGWEWVFRLPEYDYGGKHADMSPALQWLAESTDVPADAAEFATRYFGYDSSVTVAAVDLREFTPATRAVIDAALLPVDPGTSWLIETLDRHLPDTSAARHYYRWATDPAPAFHPAVRVADLLVFHIPRIRFPISDPGYVEVAVSGPERHETYAAVVVDIDGNLSPIPLRPHSEESVAAALTAAVWAPTAELTAGGRDVVGKVPAEVSQLVKLLNTGEPLHLNWSELTVATGPGPGPHATWQDLLTWWPGDPPVEPQ